MSYKILLADDSVTVQKIITLTFSDEGVDVQTVNNGDEAIHRLQYMRPALVMADVSIPGKNGYEICEFVKNHPEMKDTPVVLLVPAFEPFDEERARRIGANQHLTKPFQSIRTLISTVKGLLESHPLKIHAPMSTGPLAGSGSLTKPAPASVAEVAPPPAKVPVQSTQPFPPDSEEEETPLVQSEGVVEIESALEAESLPDQSAQEPVLEPELEPSSPVAVVEQLDEIEEEVAIAPAAVAAQPAEVVATETIAVEEAPLSVAEPRNGFAGDLDHILDLDDVLPDVWAQPPQAAAPALTEEAPQPATASPADELQPPIESAQAQSAIPQTVIDEIVNRVVAQLSEKLTQKLATQLVPEVAEIVKQQVQPEPSALPASAPAPMHRDSGPLLELD